MAYYGSIKKSKFNLYSTDANGVLDTLKVSGVKDFDIQGTELVLTFEDRVELHKINKGRVKGPYQIRRL